MRKHDDVDSKSGKLADNEDEFKPGEEDSNRAHLPLPNLSETAPAVRRERDDEKKGRYVEDPL